MMKPLTKEAWGKVTEAAIDLTNASLAQDDVLSDIYRKTLFDVLDEIKSACGEHAELLATKADFTEDERMRRDLYLKALHVAESTDNQAEILEIRESLAELKSESL